MPHPGRRALGEPRADAHCRSLGQGPGRGAGPGCRWLPAQAIRLRRADCH